MQPKPPTCSMKAKPNANRSSKRQGRSTAVRVMLPRCTPAREYGVKKRQNRSPSVAVLDDDWVNLTSAWNHVWTLSATVERSSKHGIEKQQLPPRPTWSMSRPCWGLKSVQCCEGAVPRFSAELDPYPCGTLPADACSSTKPQKTANSEWRIIFVAVHFRHLLLFNLFSF